MSFELFAFRVAEPIEASPTNLEESYNPHTQVSTWESDGTVLATSKAKCSKWYQGSTCCSHYADYCNNYTCDTFPAMICDNLG